MRETVPNQETLPPMVELVNALTDKKSELEQLGTEESYLEGLVQAASVQQGVLQKREYEMTQIQQSMDELEQKLTMEQLKQTNIHEEVVELEEIIRIDIDALLN
jgi:hypothetical protein